MAYPSDIGTTYTTKVTGDVIQASDVNNLQTEVFAIKTKLGIDNSAVTTSVDYLLKSTSSIDVGHKHNLAVSISDVVVTSPTDGQVLTYNAGTSKWTNQGTSAPDASTTVKGVSKTSVAPVSASNPIAVGDNDPRVPTQNENDALVGTSGTAVSSSNKLVDAGDVSSAGASGKIVRLSGTSYPAGNGSALTNLTVTGQLGAWATATTGSNIQATTDLMIVGYVDLPINNTNATTIATDSSATPTTVRQNISNATGISASTWNFCCPVKKNDYYKITVGASHSITAYVIPIGS